ncbi:pyruvate kinase [Pelagibacteraceae bacterium]|jgi:pyruvate kinase|nr:pyruvate kinase [Pelagibacteraceae bacterium]
MEKKAKIIATLGPAIYSKNKLKQLVNLGVDAFRINFSHNTKNINTIVSKIRKIEKISKKKISLIADLQGVKLRVGKIKNDSIKLRFNQKYIFDNKHKIGDNNRITFNYPKILKKIKRGNKILLDDGKFIFIVIKKTKNTVTTVCKSQNCLIRSNKSVHIQNLNISFNKLTTKDKTDIKSAIKLGCNWIALSYLQNEKLIFEARKLIKKDMGIIAKIENKHALKNIINIIKATDSIMIARGDLAIDIGHSEVPKVQLSLIKKCSQFSKSVIVATQMLESMIENNTATRAEINDIATAIFQGADTVMLSAEAAIGKFPSQAVNTMAKTIISTEKYKKEHIEDFKNTIISNKDPVKSILLSVKDIAYNPDVKAIIVFSNSGKSAKLVSAMRPAAKIFTISPNINVSRQVSLLWGVQSINSRDANSWKDMISISKEIIKKIKFIKKNDYVIITAGLPFGKAGMTNMIRLYKVGT